MSDRPLRPTNRAAGWESAAFDALKRSRTKEWGQRGQNTNGSPVFRYLRSLPAKAACLGCHGAQGYEEGELRGGLSISMDYTPFWMATRKHQGGLVLAHTAIAALCLAVLGWLGKKLMGDTEALREAAARIRVLEGLLPICSSCKKIRLEGGEENDQNAWVPVESYVTERSNAEFSHGFCPECLTRLYPALRAGGKRGLHKTMQRVGGGKRVLTP